MIYFDVKDETYLGLFAENEKNLNRSKSGLRQTVA